MGPGRAAGRIWRSTSEVPGGALGRHGGGNQCRDSGEHWSTQNGCPGKHWQGAGKNSERGTEGGRGGSKGSLAGEAVGITETDPEEHAGSIGGG